MMRKRRIPNTIFGKYLLVFVGIMLTANAIACIVMLISGVSRRHDIEPPVTNIILPMGILTVTIGVLLIYIATRSIIKPILQVSEASKKVAEGDFNVQLCVKGNDEISELTANFNCMVKELSANEYLHKEFVSNVSHEFKTPITSLKGYAKLLKDENLSFEKRNEYADIIINESQRLSKLSKNLLMLSKLENGQIMGKKEEFSLSEQIRFVIILLQNEWEKKNLTVNMEDSDIIILGYKDLMCEVWLNLITNAVKHCNNNGVITININQKKGTVVMVCNTGNVLSEEDCEKVFLRFYKADKSHSSSGTGLGLSIVRKIIELHSGTVCAFTREGDETVFRVDL